MVVIFRDDFETNDFSAWTSTTGSPIIVTSPVHHGTYAASFNADSTYIIKMIPSTNEIYVRLYVRWDSFTLNQYFIFSQVVDSITLNKLAGPYIFNDGGTIKWGQATFVGGYASSTQRTGATINTWYCIEVYAKASLTDGAAKMWVNGVELTDITQTGVNTIATSFDTIRVGQRESTYAVTNIIDCVDVANNYIGCERRFLPLIRNMNPRFTSRTLQHM